MDDDLKSYLYQALDGYEKMIRETEANFDDLKVLGRYTASAPYISKYFVSFLLDYAEKHGIDVSEETITFESINEKLDRLEKSKGKKYRDQLYNELEFFVKNYPAKAALFFDLEPLDIETYNDLATRDSMEILLSELKKDYDIGCKREIVLALDEVLEIKYRRHIGDIIKECPRIENPFLPDYFWWRHPSKILEEKERIRAAFEPGKTK